VKYLAPEEVAVALSVTRQTVYNWMRSGELPATKIGRTWRVTEQDINAKRRG
jgi:excisionase family DNA binding protein